MGEPKHWKTLRLLITADEQRAALENRVTATALQARREGASWSEIGRALGMSKQAAQKRYDRKLF